MTRLRLARFAVLTAALLLLPARAASAHVTIDNDEVEAGGFAILHFQVPNETASANTVKVEIAMPQDVVIPFVLARETPGWEVTVTTSPLDTPVQGEDGEITEAVTSVTFEGGEIPPGQFEIFDIELGPLPDEPGTALMFPAVQTYDDGEVVRWVEPVVEGEEEPAHPAPLLNLTAAAGAENDGSTSDDSDSNTLAIIGIVVGAVGVILGSVALVGLRRRPA